MSFQRFPWANCRTRSSKILARFWSYCAKTVQLPDLLATVKDPRKYPKIPTSSIVQNALAMFVARLGSLNALELLHRQRSKHPVLGAQTISADTMGRVIAEIDTESLRDVQRESYSKFKRQKALETPLHGLIALAIDGHESHSTCKQKCSGCLTRDLPTGRQYYHRNVTAQLIFKNCTFLLDAEPQLRGESETGAAKRLFARVVKRFPRAFDVVLCDALSCTDHF